MNPNLNPNVNPNVNINSVAESLNNNPDKEEIIKTMLSDTPITDSLLVQPMFKELNNVQKNLGMIGAIAQRFGGMA